MRKEKPWVQKIKRAFLFEMEMGRLGHPFQQCQTLRAQQNVAGKAWTQGERFPAPPPTHPGFCLLWFSLKRKLQKSVLFLFFLYWHLVRQSPLTHTPASVPLETIFQHKKRKKEDSLLTANAIENAKTLCLNQKEAIFHSPLFLALVFSILLSITYNKILEHLETRENKE